MYLLGLTGSIGMGKSETARMFRRLAIPVYDADAAVHRLLARGGAAVPLIETAFPGSVRDGAVDRPALGRMVFGRPEALRRLEGILHPMVGKVQRRFLMSAALRRAPLVVLDVPLLYETGGERRVDAVAVVTAPPFVQRQRVLRRPGMEPEKFRQILRQQVPDREKRRRADFLVPTGLGRRRALEKVLRICRSASGRRSRVWPRRGFQPLRKPSYWGERFARNRP